MRAHLSEAISTVNVYVVDFVHSVREGDGRTERAQLSRPGGRTDADPTLYQMGHGTGAGKASSRRRACGTTRPVCFRLAERPCCRPDQSAQ